MTTTTNRYEIRAIGDENMTSVNDQVLASTDDAAEAKALASQHSAGETYGTAIVDTQTGAIDFGGEQDE